MQELTYMEEVHFLNNMLCFLGKQFPTCGDLDDIVKSIYDTGMVQIRNDGTFMGMWQLWVAANVIGRPIRSVFPEHGSYQFRSDFNRFCVPLNERCRKHVPLSIMWTPVTPNGTIVHFVPLLRKKLIRYIVGIMLKFDIALWLLVLLYFVKNMSIYKSNPESNTE